VLEVDEPVDAVTRRETRHSLRLLPDAVSSLPVTPV